MPCHGLVKRVKDFWKKQREDAERLVKAVQKNDDGVIEVFQANLKPRKCKTVGCNNVVRARSRNKSGFCKSCNAKRMSKGKTK